MSDPTPFSTPVVDAPPVVDAAPPAEPVVDVVPPATAGPTNDELLAEVAQLKAELQAERDTRAAEPAPVEEPKAPERAAYEPAAGDRVVHRYEDPLDGEVAQYGVVLEVTEHGHAIVGWFAGASGPLQVDRLEQA